MPNATILLPNFNNERVLPLMFDYLRRNVDCRALEFVMVDDGSEDASVKVAKAELDRTPFARAEIVERKHEGVVEALNAGLAQCRTRIVLRIDGDATVEVPDWDRRLCQWLDNFPELGVVGGQVIFDDGRLHSLGRAVLDEWGLRDMGCWPHEAMGMRTSDANVIRPVTRFIAAVPYEVDSILGVCVAFRRSDALDAGGFDTRYSPVWIEDDDFGLQLRKIGKRVLVDPEIQVVHRTSLRNSRQPGRLFASAVENRPTASRVQIATQKLRHVARSIKREFTSRPKSETALFSPNSLPELWREGDSWRFDLLKRHYVQWRQKWGFDPLNPNLADLYQLFGDDHILGWRLTPTAWSTSQVFCRAARAFALNLRT